MNETIIMDTSSIVLDDKPQESEQHTLGWYRARLGNFTGSNVWKLTKESRSGGFSETANSYIYNVAATRYMNPLVVNDDNLFDEYLNITNVETKAMRWGTEQEEYARQLYAKLKGYAVVERGSVAHKTIPHFASSPDGYIPDDGNGKSGCLEIKCPNQDTYMRYRNEVVDGETLKKVKPEYYWQCQCHMMCTGAEWCDFIAYCPWQAKPIHIVRILPCQEDMQLIESKINKAELIIEKLK